MATLSSRINDLAGAVREKINAMMPRLIPSGGTSGQVLAKASATNYDAAWTTLSGSGTPVSSLPAISYLAGPELVQVRSGSTDYQTTVSQFNGGAFVRLQSPYSLTNTTAQQKLFNATTNGALTLYTGTYLIESWISINSMSGTSGNASFSLIGPGTATISRPLLHAVGVDGVPASASNQTGSWITSTNPTFPASILTGGTSTWAHFSIRGTFEVTTAGTIIPSVSLATASAASVLAGSFLQIKPLGAAAASYSGNWS